MRKSSIIDARLGNTSGPAGFENVHRLAFIAFRHPTPHRAAAQGFVFEQAEFLQIVEGMDFLARVPIELLGGVEPEGAAGVGVEMPGDDLAHMGVELLASRADFLFEVG